MASHTTSNPHPPMPASHVASARHASEQRLGIHHFVSPVDFGWQGDLRKRYTDFLVYEVRRNGTVLHLTDFQQGSRPGQTASFPPNVNAHGEAKPQRSFQANRASSPKAPVPTEEVAEYKPVSEDDVKILEDLVGAQSAAGLLDLDRKICSKDGQGRGVQVNFPPITDRAQRTKVHQEIRRIFSSRIETQVGNQGIITAAAAVASRGSGRGNGPANRQTGLVGRDNWRGGQPRHQRGDYLHFTLYKENKDTMDAVNHIARMLKIKASNFGFAGTKDRRAATVQRISIWHKDIKEVNSLNDKMSGIRVGDFSYQKKPMQLGQHGGNDFVIVLKNVTLARGNQYSLSHRLKATEQCIQAALDSVAKDGFLNYFGLQRFGTHAIGTQEVGMKILRNDFMGAVDAILHVEPELASLSVSEGANDGRFHRDEFDRARAIAVWKMSGNADTATRMLPKKYGAELNLIRHLGKSPNDFCGALLSITRGLRNLYIHAYQSYVWNYVASRRWAQHGNKVIKGDLVLVEQDRSATGQGPVEDMSEDRNQEEEEFYQQARILTEEDVASGRYTIFDIVLPVPGFDIIYPDNDIGDFYVEFMSREENGALNPYDMRRRQREFSLSGHYRKVVATFTATPAFAVRAYSDDEEQMHPTDRDLIEWRKKADARQNPEATSAWNHFAHNTSTFDAADAEELRRKKAESPMDQVAETRINDAWIETGLDGGKRFKVNPQVHQEHVVRHAARDGEAQAQNLTSSLIGGGEMGLHTASNGLTLPVAGPASVLATPGQAPNAVHAVPAMGVHSDNGDVDMKDAGQPRFASDFNHGDHALTDENIRPGHNDTSSTPHAELFSYLENHLKSTASETSPPSVSSQGFSRSQPMSSFASVVSAEGVPAPSLTHLPVAADIKVEADNEKLVGKVAVEASGQFPPDKAAESLDKRSPTGSAFPVPGPSPVRTSFMNEPRFPVFNVFEDIEPSKSRYPAVNVSRKLDGTAQPHDTKVAVILNFRLSSSMYATICIREMMGQVGNNGL